MLAHVDNRITYNGNGNATEFAYQFKILDRTDIKVLLTDADGKEKLLTKDYYVDVEKSVVRYPGYAVGAEVPESERPPVLPTGWKLTIYREVPVTQETDLPDQYPFNQIEDIVDKLTMIAQQLTDVASRSLKISVNKSADIDTTIPWENGKSFRISDDGKTLELSEDPAKVLPLAQGVYAQTQAQAQSAAASAVAAAKSEDSAAASASKAGNSAQSASVSAASAAENAELTSGYKQEALNAKADATASATNAKASEANAEISENNAEASKEAAQSAATAASNFASAARNSAGEAKTYKDNAKTYMDNAELYMNNAKNYSENVNVFVPSVSSAGVLSWTNKAGLPNPASVNIKGVKGDAGTAATITIGSVTTGEPGTNASVTNSGTSTNAILNFTIPRGNPGSGGGTSVEVDAALSDTSLNPVQNKVIKAALDGKLNTTDTATAAQKLTASKVTAVNVGRPIVFFSNDSGGAWLEACYDTNFKYNTVTKDLTVGTINGVDVTAIDTTYAKKTDISGVVKSVNGTAPDASGNVTITATGGVSTSSANTWTAVQEFYNTKTFRACHTGYFVEGTSDTPVTDTMWYTTNGDFTLNLSNFAMLLGTYESIVFSAYFTADADHALTISGAGTMTYIGSASDIAISGSGTLLTVWMIKNSNGVVSIVQAHKLGSGT
ncbi:MAG: hypothetical protein ACLUUD_09780 [Phascolarctobacterium succinatutens]|uniref:hypothetical protein n=1 Tax=Phascolarctobacterium succinatutens TaxID=626940 RepID=UPI0039942BB8